MERQRYVAFVQNIVLYEGTISEMAKKTGMPKHKIHNLVSNSNKIMHDGSYKKKFKKLKVYILPDYNYNWLVDFDFFKEEDNK